MNSTLPKETSAPPRVVGVLGLAAIAYFCVSGGPYEIEEAVQNLGARSAVIWIIVTPWIWAIPVALMTMELSSRIPEQGGYVAWVDAAFGQFWGFQVGWWSWLSSFADVALYPVMFADYVQHAFLPSLTREQEWIFALAVIYLFAWINVRGARFAAANSVLLGVMTLLPFIPFIGKGIASRPLRVPAAGPGKTDFSRGLPIMLWNYGGWDNAGCCAGEVVDASKTYVRALFATSVLVMFVYLLPVLVGLAYDPNINNWESGYLASLARRIGGEGLASAVGLGGILSSLGLLNTLLLTNTRVPYAMAKNGTLPGAFALLHPRYGTPWFSILFSSTIYALLTRLSFGELVQYSMWLYALSLIPEFCALVKLRLKGGIDREGEDEREIRPGGETDNVFQVPGGLLGLILCVVAGTGVSVLLLVTADQASMKLGAFLAATGPVAYLVYQKRRFILRQGPGLLTEKSKER